MNDITIKEKDRRSGKSIFQAMQFIQQCTEGKHVVLISMDYVAMPRKTYDEMVDKIMVKTEPNPIRTGFGKITMDCNSLSDERRKELVVAMFNQCSISELELICKQRNINTSPLTDHEGKEIK